LDFDGTLANSSQGIYAAFVAACKEARIHSPDFDQFCAYIGPPVQVIAKKLVPDIEVERLELLRSRFRLEYDNKYFSMVQWYEGVLEGLNWLALQPDVCLSIVTNKPTQPTNNIIQAAGIGALFSCVVGIDYRDRNSAGSAFDSKSEAIDFALSLTQCPRERAVYVGDTPSDRQASEQQEIRFIAAGYGFHRWQPTELEGTVAASSFADVIAALDLGASRSSP
jgi:phosphoglycolate phosphatase